MALLLSIGLGVSAAEPELPLELESQSLSASLTHVAQAFDLTVMFFSEDIKGLRAPPLSGTFSSPQAFTALLEGTPLEFEYVSRTAVAVRLRSSAIDRLDVNGEKGMQRVGVKRSLLGRIVTALSVAFAAGPVVAEEAPRDNANIVEEIVVSAQRREEAIGDVPISMTAFDETQLEFRGLRTMTDLQFAVPSLHLSEVLGTTSVQIRGLGTVSVNVDGVVLTGGTLGLDNTRFSQLDLDRVEVLRGPQGTLYGRNTNGGVVNLTSALPGQMTEGSIRTGVAEYDEWHVAAIYSTPLTERVGFRIAGEYSDQGDGWIENLVVRGGDDLMQGSSSNVKATLSFAMTDTLNFDLRYQTSELDGIWDHNAWYFQDPTSPTVIFTPSLTEPKTFKPLKTYQAADADTGRERDIFSLTTEWSSPIGLVRSITAYQDFTNGWDMDRTALGTKQHDSLFDSETQTFTQEINVLGGGDSVNWVLGGYYMDSTYEQENTWYWTHPIIVFPLPPIFHFDVDHYDTKSMAAFVDVTVNVTNRARITLGARYSKDEVDGRHKNAFDLQTTPAPIQVLVLCDREFEDEWSEPTFRAVGQYDLTDDSNAYASFSQGYRSGGFGTSECSPAFKPELVDAYEIGYKARLFGGRTELSTALFFYDYTDFQIMQVIGFQTNIRSAGEAEGKGAELELTTQLSDHWSWDVGTTLLESEYSDFVNVDALRPLEGPRNVGGNALNNAPETSVNVGLTFRGNAPWGGQLTARADAAYRSRTYFSEFNTNENSQDAYTIVNVNATWESADDRWTTRLYAKNVTDEEYAMATIVDNNSAGIYAAWGPPRIVGMEVTRRF